MQEEKASKTKITEFICYEFVSKFECKTESQWGSQTGCKSSWAHTKCNAHNATSVCWRVESNRVEPSGIRTSVWTTVRTKLKFKPWESAFFVVLSFVHLYIIFNNSNNKIRINGENVGIDFSSSSCAHFHFEHIVFDMVCLIKRLSQI